MTPQSKTNLLDPTFIDTIISGEIPNEQNALLRQIVLKKHNMHISRSHLSPPAVRKTYNSRSKRFPIDFDDETGHNEAQLYITYRRWSLNAGGKTAPWIYRTPKRASIMGTVDKSWVVPYCPNLSIMIQSRLNVELCVSQSSAIEYLIK